MARRHYSSIAARTTLASGVDDTTTTFVVTAVSNWPASYPYTLIVDQDTVNEEIVEVTARSGTTLTVTRGVDGSSAVAHSSGAAVNHGVSARDFDEPNDFINNDIPQSKITDLTSDLASKLDLAGGKILQIVRATDSTNRSTTSTSYVDVTGMSVTITPQKSDSAIIVAALFVGESSAASAGTRNSQFRITDSSNNSLSGAEETRIVDVEGEGIFAPVNMWGYSTPATTSATTYKLRFRSSLVSTTTSLRNNNNTGQMYAIEVSA